MSNIKHDICIIGAGVAGCAMAAYLADNGFKVIVVEKDLRERDVIIGELMQPGGVMQMKLMGLDSMFEGFDAQVVTGYALFLRDQKFSITYPDDQTGRGFHNGKFLQKMRSYILPHPNVTVIEGTVTDLLEDNGSIKGIRYNTKEDENLTITSLLTVVCDGMFSIFRARLSDNPKKVSSYFLGFVMHDCKLPFPGHGHVIAADPSPMLAYPISSTETRVLIDFPGEAPRKGEELTAYLNDKLGPQMPESIQPSFYNAVKEGKFKVMPNHLIPARPRNISGAVLIGDSLNMRHPLTGGGMTVALSDVRHLSDRLIGIKDSYDRQHIDEAVFAFYRDRYEMNASVNILADALYGVMSEPDLREACYTYLQKGGDNASIPLSLLSALNRDNSQLLQHFFMVAVHGAKQVLLPPTPANIKRSYKMFKSAVQIISPLVLNQSPGPITRATFKVAEKVF